MGKSLTGKELGMGISQRKDGRYEGRFTDRKGKRRTIYSTKLTELRSKLEELKVADKKYLPGNMDSTLRLDEWFDQWMEIYKNKDIKESSKAEYIKNYKVHISPALGSEYLRNISQLAVQSFLNSLADKHLSKSKQNNIKTLLNGVMKQALANQFITVNPVSGTHTYGNDAENKKVLTIKEQQEFFKECAKSYYDEMFRVAVLTGLRPGELFALTWADVDFEKKLIKVDKTLSYFQLGNDDDCDFHLTEPKTKASKRSIPMTKYCEEALRSQKVKSNTMKLRCGSKRDSRFGDLVFMTRKGTPINRSAYRNFIVTVIDRINKHRNENEEKLPRFGGHTFRHTFATRCFEAGMTPKSVQALLGHSKIDITMNTYTHVLEIQQQDDMQLLEKKLVAIM